MSKTKAEIKELNKKLSKKNKKYKKAMKQLAQEEEKYMKNKSVQNGMQIYQPIMTIANFYDSLNRIDRNMRDKIYTTVRFVEWNKNMYTNIFDIRVQKDYYRFRKHGFDTAEIFIGIDERDFDRNLLAGEKYKITGLNGYEKRRFPNAKIKLIIPYYTFIKTIKTYYEHTYEIGCMFNPKTDYLLLNIFYSIGIKITSKENNLYLINNKEITLTFNHELYSALFGEDASFIDAPNNLMKIFNQDDISSCFHKFIEEHVSLDAGRKEKKHDKKRSKKEAKKTSKKTR